MKIKRIISSKTSYSAHSRYRGDSNRGDGLKVRERYEQKTSSLIWGIFVAWLMLFAWGGLFITGLSLKVYISPLIICSVISSLVCGFYLQLCIGKKFKYAVPAVALAVLILAGVFFHTLIYDGFALMGNGIKDLLSFYTLKIYMPYAISGVYSEKTALTFFAVWLIPFLTVMAVYICLSRNFFPRVSAIIISFLLGFLLGKSGNLIFGSLLAAALISCVLLYFNRNRRADILGNIIIIGLTVVFCTFPLWLSVNAEKPGFLQNTSNLLYDLADNIRWGKDDTNNLPHGRLYKTDSLDTNDKVALTVAMDNPVPLYLRGYVGSIYIGKEWEDLPPAELVSEKSVIYTLHKNGFYGFSQLEHAVNASGIESDDNSVEINNINVRKETVYAPYEIKTADRGEPELFLDDSLFKSAAVDDASSASYTIGSNQVRNIKPLADSLARSEGEEVQSYLQQEALYRDFVYNNFCAIPEDTAELISVHLDDLERNKEGRASYTEALQSVITYLLTEITYNENCGAFEDGSDFLSSFMEFHGEGYSVHYATAATLMLRWYGIPTRYVEGFILTPEDVAGIPGGEAVEITGKNAHAWTEYYRDGVGWVPFEVTPPYIFIMEQQDDLSEIYDEDLLQQYNTEGLTELTEDNYEEEDETKGKNKEESSFNWLVHLLVLFAELSVLLLMCVAYFLLRRRFIISEEKLCLKYMTDRQRVQFHFTSIMKLLEYTCGKHGGNGMEQYIEQLERNGEHESALLLQVLLPLQRRAAFSNEPVSADAAYSLEKCREAIDCDAGSKLKFCQRIKIKYFKNLI